MFATVTQVLVVAGGVGKKSEKNLGQRHKTFRPMDGMPNDMSKRLLLSRYFKIRDTSADLVVCDA